MKSFRITLTEILFVALFLMLIAISYLSYQRINGLIDSSELINQSNAIKLKLEQAHSYLKDVESSQRGYLLTQDSTFLDPFYGAFSKAQERLKEVDSLTADNAEQQESIKELQALINVRYDLLNSIIKRVDSTHHLSGVTPFLLLGKKTMDDVRTRIDEMMHLEDKLLRMRTKERNRFAALSPLFLLLLSLFTLSIGILALLKIESDTSRLAQLVENLRLRDTQLTAKNAELLSSNKELASFSYIAAHDLKEPLRKIQMFSSRIMENDKESLSKSGKEDFARVIASVQRLQDLLDALLEFSQTSNAEIIFEPTDLNTILQEAKEDLKHTIEEKKAVIESVALPSIPVVPVQFRQLFVNIIGNALKYAKADVPPNIKITALLIAANTKHPAGWQFSFSDNGIGFEQEYEPKIFQPFQRLHGKTEYSGTGMGLAICKKIVLNHHGTISATSQPGVGTTLHVFIPKEK